MPTLRDIRRRIVAVRNTQKITKAMKMVAAVKFKRAQDAIFAARPYAKELKQLLQHIGSKIDVSTYELYKVKPVERVLMIIVTADRGLCGAFNSNLIKTAINHINTKYPHLIVSDGVKLFCIGKKGFDFFVKWHFKIVGKHVGIFSALKFSHAQAIVSEVVQGFLRDEYDIVEVVYNEFKSIIQQKIVIEQLLPIPSIDSHIPQHKARSLVDYIYEPSSEKIISALIPKHLNFQMWRILLESNAAEQGARMSAMDNATTNAGKLLNELQLSYNKARQASITKELLEIVSGAEALKKAV